MSAGGTQRLSADELKRLSSDYKQKAEQLQELAAFLDRQVSSAIWRGNAATGFRDEWAQHTRSMTGLTSLMNYVSRKLNEKVDPARGINIWDR